MPSASAPRVVQCACLFALMTSAVPALAHGLAGNRFFPGTLAFDDPAVGEELDFPLINIANPAPNGTRTANYGFQFTRLLTDRVAVGIFGGVDQRFGAGEPTRTGFQQTTVEVKARLLEDDPHELLVAASLQYTIGASGSFRVGAGGPDTIQPGIFFGKGFGDLPDSLRFLKPFAVSGVFQVLTPLQAHTDFLFDQPNASVLIRTNSANPEVIDWGLALTYSTYYLTDRYTGQPPAEEPLHQFVPIIEFAVTSPLKDTPAYTTVATANPGLVYVGSFWQVAGEAILPLDRGAGHGVGARLQLLLFLDDLVPALFGQPLFH